MRLVWFLVILLAVPIVPLLLLGEGFESFLLAVSQAAPGRPALVGLVTLLLAGDIFLPVPSGPLIALAGAKLGLMLAAVVSTAGLTLGAAIGLAAARRWGRRLAERYAKPADLDRLGQAFARHGVWILLATRPLPLLAEAAVLACGLTTTPLRRALPPLLVGNLLFASLAASLGESGAANEKLMLVLFFSAAVPLLLAELARRRWLLSS